MRLFRPAAFISLGFLLISGSCAHRGAGIDSRELLQLRLAFAIIAPRGELRAFSRAAKAGPDSQQAFLNAFWEVRDPTPGTAFNEYQERFEARYLHGAELFVPARGGVIADERLSAYIRFGEPAFEDRYQMNVYEYYIGWIYEPDPDVVLAGRDHPLLNRLDYAATFSRNRNLEHSLHPSSNYPWPRLLPLLTESDIHELDAILSDIQQDRYLRAAAAWRLRADPDIAAFAALIRSADTDDEYVREVIAGAFDPLTPVELGINVPSAAGEEGNRNRFRGFLGDVRVPTYEDSLSLVGDVFTGENPLSLVYDPGSALSPQATTELRLEAGMADSVLPARGWLSPDESAAIYTGALERARSLLSEGNVLQVHELLDPLLKTTYLDNPEAFHLDALALMDSGSPGGRMLAQERVFQALRLDPGNMRFRLTLAMILSRRTLDVAADRILDDIIEEVRAAADAYALKARMRLETYWALGWRATGWATPVFEEATDPDVAIAEVLDLLNRALVIDPDNELATWWLGTHYILTGEWRDVVPIMTYMIDNNVHSAEAYLGRGMAFQHLRRPELAWSDYLEAMALLSDEMQFLADDPRWALPPSEGGSMPQSWSAMRTSRGRSQSTEMSITGEERDIFWRSKDPLFSTPVNERAMEQYRRFAYVTWRFAVPNLGLRGWETHRGRVYLRYGEPLFIESQQESLREMMDPVLDPDAVEEPLSDKATGRLYFPSEIWQYDELTFTFGGGMTTGNLKLWPSDTHYAIDSIADFERLAEETPESAKVEGGRRIVEMETTWYRFESSAGESEFVPVIQLPEFGVHGIRPLVEGVQMPVHFMILEDSWQTIKSSSQDLRLGRLGRVSARDWVGDGISLASGAVTEGAEYAAVEIVPPGSAPAFVSRDTLDGMPVSGLRLSSLVAATNVLDSERVVVWPANSYFTRFGQAILPRPSVQFELNEPIYFYYEIYGLTRDEIRATRYQIALTVTSQRERGLLAPIVDALGQLVGRTAQEGSVTLLFDRGGIQTRTSERLRMVFPQDRRADSYLVTIEVIDQVSGERFERSIVVEIGR